MSSPKSNTITRETNQETDTTTYSFYGETIWTDYIELLTENRNSHILLEMYYNAIKNNNQEQQQACDVLLRTDNRHADKITSAIECYIQKKPVVVVLDKNTHINIYDVYDNMYFQANKDM